MVDARERMRREKVRILLRTRNDAYPTVRARATPYTSAGPGRAEDLRKKKCPACQGTGKTRLHQKCSSCDGAGKFAVDGYVGRVSQGRQTIYRNITPEAADAEIARLQTSLKLSEGQIDPQEKFGWERAREAQNAAGSYRELERVLEWMRMHRAQGWDFLMWAYGSLTPPLSRKDSKIENYLIGELAARMPAKILVPKQEWESLREQRKARIRELAQEATPEEIAEEVGLPVRVVQLMLTESARS